jgi:ELWxxDGT repeat protein
MSPLMRIPRLFVLLLALPVAMSPTVCRAEASREVDAAPPIGSSPSEFSPLGTVALFAAFDATGGQAAWRTDGTVAGTFRLSPDCGPQCVVNYGLPLGSAARLLMVYPASGAPQLWVTAGTVESTVELAEVVPTGFPLSDGLWVPEQGLLYFLAFATPGDEQLWRTDGTPGGTFAVRSLPSQLAPSLADFRGKLYFDARDGSDSSELWESDGTPAGTRPFVSLGLSAPSWLGVAGDHLVLVIDGKLWSTDGTAAGTVVLNGPGEVNFFGPFWSFGDRVLILGSDGSFFKLWVTDGTNPGTRRLTDLTWSSPSDFLGRAFGDRFYFSLDDHVHGSSLWVTDGTVGGTHLFADLCRSPCRRVGYTYVRQVVGRELLFLSDDGVNGERLWSTDGTESGTRVIASTCAGNCSVVDDVLGKVGPWIVFLGAGASGAPEIWRTNLGGNTARLTAFDPSFLSSPYVFQGTFIPGLMLFAGEDAVHGIQLWRSNGTRAGTRLLEDLGPPGSAH